MNEKMWWILVSGKYERILKPRDVYWGAGADVLDDVEDTDDREEGDDVEDIAVVGEKLYKII